MSLKARAEAVSPNALMSARWDEGLSDVRHPVANDSLIPMFEREKTVLKFEDSLQCTIQRNVEELNA